MSAGEGGPASEPGWFEQLEAQLERQLQAFLAANPGQEALLQHQERQEKHQRLKRRRIELQSQADQARAALLALVAEINAWQQRVGRARQAGAVDLADRAEQHLGQLMGQGRDRWQALGELGAAVQTVERELEQLAPPGPCRQPAPTQAWAGWPRSKSSPGRRSGPLRSPR